MDKREKRPADEASMPEQEIDTNLEETFPASDPPSWTLGVGPDHDPAKKKAEKPDKQKKKGK